MITNQRLRSQRPKKKVKPFRNTSPCGWWWCKNYDFKLYVLELISLKQSNAITKAYWMRFNVRNISAFYFYAAPNEANLKASFLKSNTKKMVNNQNHENKWKYSNGLWIIRRRRMLWIRKRSRAESFRGRIKRTIGIWKGFSACFFWSWLWSV